MSKFGVTLRLTPLAAAMIGVGGPVLAQDAELKALTTPNSSVSVGAGYWSDNRPETGIYDGMREKGGYGLVDADVTTRDSATGTWFNINARNLGLDTRELQAEWLRQGNIGVALEYSRIPRDTPYYVNTGLVGFGTTTQIRTTITPGTGTNYDIGTVRDNLGLKFYKNLARGFDFNFKFVNEEKTGTRHTKRGGAAEFAVEPFDATTQIAEATLSYDRDSLQLAGGYIGTWYKNANNLLTAQGPTPATTYYISLPLDNEAHQLFINGGYKFTPTTRGTFKLAYTRATQNEHIPTKDIPGLSLPSSPDSLNGRLDTTLAQFGLTARPMSQLSLVADLRYHNVDEKTPQVRFVQATSTGHICDSAVVNNVVCADNTPLSFETITGKVEATYRLPQQFSLIGGIEYRQQDRTVPVGRGTVVNGVDDQRYVPFRAELEEMTYRLQVRRSMAETVNGSIAYLHSDRKGSEYTRTNETESDEINPLHIADRKRDKLRATVDWMPTPLLTLQFNAEGAVDSYGTSSSRPYGLKEGEAMLFSLDASYAISEAWNLTAWLSHDQTKATQHAVRAANGGAALAEKEAELEEQGNSIGLGLRGRLAPKIRIGADLQYTETTSKYPETLTLLGAGTAYPSNAGDVAVGPLRDIQNKLSRLKLFGVYALQKNADIRLDYIYEQWSTDDWTWTFADGSPFIYGADAPPASVADGTTVITTPKYTSHFIGARYTYKFQ